MSWFLCTTKRLNVCGFYLHSFAATVTDSIKIRNIKTTIYIYRNTKRQSKPTTELQYIHTYICECGAVYIVMLAHIPLFNQSINQSIIQGIIPCAGDCQQKGICKFMKGLYSRGHGLGIIKVLTENFSHACSWRYRTCAREEAESATCQDLHAVSRK